MTALEDRSGDVAAAGRLTRVAPSQIELDPENRTVTEESVDRLVPSVTELGVLQPVLVVELDDGRFGLVDGERRTRAAVKADLAEIPAFVSDDLQDRRRFVEASTVANLTREDFHPLDEAHKFDALVAVGHSHRSIADLLDGAWSHSTVTKRLAVLHALQNLDGAGFDLTATALEAAYRAGHLTVRHAEVLASLIDELLEAPSDPDAVESSLAVVVEIAGAEHRRRELEHELPRLEKAAKQARAQRGARAELALAGVRDVTGVPFEDDWEYLSMFGGDFDKEAHRTEPCHAAHVTSFGDVRPLCTNPTSHPEFVYDDDDEHRSQDDIAADQAAAAAARAAVDRELTPEQRAAAQRATARRDAVLSSTDARDARRQAVVSLAGAERSATRALTLLLTMLLDDDPFFEYVAEDIIAVLGIDVPEGTGDDEYRRLIADWRTSGGDRDQRMATAFAAVLGEEQLTGVVNTGADRDFSPICLDAALTYLAALVDTGYEPTSFERALLDGARSYAFDVHDDAEAGRDAELDSSIVDDGDGDVALDVAAPSMVFAAVVARLSAAAATLRSGPKKGKTYTANVGLLDDAKRRVLDVTVEQVRSLGEPAVHEFASQLHAHDVTTRLEYEEHGVVQSDADLERFHAATLELWEIFDRFGVHLAEQPAGILLVVRRSWENEGMPDWVRLDEIIAAFGPDAVLPLAHGDVPEHRYRGESDGPCEVCGEPRASDAHYDVDGNPITADGDDRGVGDVLADVTETAGVATVAWRDLENARAAFVKAPKKGKRRDEIAAAYVEALEVLCDTLVAGHPDVFDLTTSLVAVLERLRSQAPLAADMANADARTALSVGLLDEVLALVEPSNPPDDLVAAARAWNELVLAEDPPPAATLGPRRVYVDDLLAAAERRR